MSCNHFTVAIRGLEAFGRHGVHDAERELGQRFLVDLELRLDDIRAAATDDLLDTLDYAKLAAAVEAIVGGRPVRLLETLADAIADAALAEPYCVAAIVTVRKPHVALPQVVQEVAVTRHRHRPGPGPDPAHGPGRG